MDTEALFRRLLALNALEIHGAAFAVRDPYVLLVAERTTRDLDRSEVYDLIHRVQEYADAWDDALVSEFGGTLGIPE